MTQAVPPGSGVCFPPGLGLFHVFQTLCSWQREMRFPGSEKAKQLEAITSRLEAIASRIEAIASRLEAISSRLRLEAI